MSEIPESWVEVRFRDINTFAARSVDPSAYPEELFELYSVPTFPTRKPEMLLGREIGSTKQAVEPDDVLVCKINPRINRVWQVMASRERPQIASSEWIVMRAPGFCEGFLRHYFTSPAFRELICEGVTGVGGSLTRAQPKRVAEFSIPVAPFPEQNRIAYKLDSLLARVDSCRERLDRVPDMLKRLRQSVFSAATGGELTREWREERGLSFNWLPSTFGSVGEVTGGITKNARRANTSLMRPYLRVANVYANRLVLDDVAEIATTPDEFARTRLRPEDILIVEGNGSIDQIGRAALWRGELDECAHQNHLIRWRTRGAVAPEFALYWLLSPTGRESLVEFAKSSAGLHTLSMSKVSAVPLFVPPLDEQKEVVRRVGELLQVLERLECKLANAQSLVARTTPSALAKAFRGQLVPQDPNDESTSAFLAKIKAERTNTAAEHPRRRTMIKRKRADMSDTSKDAIKAVILNMRSKTFSFDDLGAKFPGDYESLKAAVFELLDEPKPIIRQVFNKKAEAIRFERATP